MSWVKLDDQFPDHPKLLSVTPSARWLYVCALCYSARYLTDGRIPKAVIGNLAGTRSAHKDALQLCCARLFLDDDSDYVIHDYLEYNPRGKEVRASRSEVAEKRSLAGKKGAAARWGRDLPDGKADGKPIASAIANGWQTDGKAMAPSPSPSPKQSSSASHGTFRGVSETPDDDDDDDEKKVQQALDLVADRRTDRKQPENPSGYRRVVRASLNNGEADELRDHLERHPHLTASDLADRLERRHEGTVGCSTCGGDHPLDQPDEFCRWRAEHPGAAATTFTDPEPGEPSAIRAAMAAAKAGLKQTGT